jgi:hypothetical protein
MPLEFLTHFLTRHEMGGARSSVLRPLQGLLVVLVGALLILVEEKASPTLIYSCALFCAITVTCYIAAFCYFARRDPDALRSENFSLKKIELQRGLQGDSLSGIASDDVTKATATLIGPPTQRVPRELR